MANIPTNELVHIICNSANMADDVAAYILGHVEPVDLAIRTDVNATFSDVKRAYESLLGLYNMGKLRFPCCTSRHIEQDERSPPREPASEAPDAHPPVDCRIPEEDSGVVASLKKKKKKKK